jgi:hypothetical protein
MSGDGGASGSSRMIAFVVRRGGLDPAHVEGSGAF